MGFPVMIMIKNSNDSEVRIKEPESRIEAVYAVSFLYQVEFNDVYK